MWIFSPICNSALQHKRNADGGNGNGNDSTTFSIGPMAEQPCPSKMAIAWIVERQIIYEASWEAGYRISVDAVTTIEAGPSAEVQAENMNEK